MYFFLLILFFVIISLGFNILNKKFNILALCSRVKTVNGEPFEECAKVVPGKSIFGNNLDVINLNPEKLFYSSRDYVRNAGGSYFQFFIGSPVYNITTPEDAELILTSQNLISKGVVYSYLETFLGTGLLTSQDKKWHSRRKLLTPAFHFSILPKFLEIFNEESKKFLKLLEDKGADEIISLTELIPKFTLNNICETALGVNLDDINKSDEYRKNIRMAEYYFLKRVCNPLKFYELIYNRLKESLEYNKIVKKLHEFSSGIIRKRRAKFQNKNSNLKSAADDDDDDGDTIFYFKKERHAMLDTLLSSESEGLIDHSGICEEVNTFMFEGFDTTSSGLIFPILLLAIHQDVQQKCYEEICSIKDQLCDLTSQNFNDLKYLDCVVKESLRLYPPVPFVSRIINDDTIYGNFILPKGTNINVHIFDIHRDPKHYSCPEKFDPDRFFPGNSVKRHPFAFIPFSAGPRNCIGQKFAQLEIKVLLVNLLKTYKILPVTKLEDIRFESGLVLRSKYPIEVKCLKRST